MEKCYEKRNKGFTLAEMLIVVAIIGVLVAITSAVISTSLERSREAADLANIKAAFSELTQYAISGEKTGFPAYIVRKTSDNIIYYYTYVQVTQRQKGWQTKGLTLSNGKAVINGATITADFSNYKDRAYKITVYADGRENMYLVNLMTISNTQSVHNNDRYYRTNEFVRPR